MKLSFSLSSKPSSKPNLKASQNLTNNEDQDKEYVNEFDPSKTLTDNKSKKLVIPPKENEWRPFKKMKNLDLPHQSDGHDLRFELESSRMAEEPHDSNISYGLNLRQSTMDDVDEGKKSKESESDEWSRSAPVETMLLQKLRDDLRRLPEDRGFDEFADVPVEGFGAALLAGYGWYEGRGIGRNTKEDVKVVQYEKRTDKEGLGFVPDMHMGNARKENGKERAKERVDKVAELGSKEKEKSLNKLKELEIRGGKKDTKRSREEGKRGSDNRREEQQRKGSHVSWLRSHIRVRIISKDFRGGKLYLKKGEVVDVVGPRTCDISMDESREVIQGVDQEVLETALPRRGGPVLVLYGRHKGVYGNLVEKDLDQETGVVQDADSHDLLSVQLQQIAEYIGDPSDIGY